MKFNVLSFNLRYWNEDDGEHAWPYRKDSVAQVMRQHNPVVVGTQEGLLPMLEDLDQRLPKFNRVGSGRGSTDSDEYCAIYYRKDLLDVVTSNQIWLSKTPELPGSKSWDSWLPRICTWAVFQDKQTKNQFVFFNTHLDHIGSEARQKGVELIWQNMSNYIEQQLPCILTGDFNCYPDSSPILFLRSKLVDTLSTRGQSSPGTFHGFRGAAGPEPIDYIFCTPDITVLEAQVLDEKVEGVWPSDHHPLFAMLNL